jgi:transcriptional regulator GlxA family with amidase domain
MYQDKKKIVLGFLIFPGFPMSCLTSAIEPLRAANEIAGAEVFAWN